MKQDCEEGEDIAIYTRFQGMKGNKNGKVGDLGPSSAPGYFFIHGRELQLMKSHKRFMYSG